MNRERYIQIAILLTVIIGGLFIVTRPDDSAQIPFQREIPQPDNIEQSRNEGRNLPLNYIEYTDTSIAETSGTKVLYFHAEWCVSCKLLERSIEEDGIPEEITFIRANYDQDKGLREKYGVTLQTFTILIDDDGNEIRSYFAGENPTVESVLKNLEI